MIGESLQLFFTEYFMMSLIFLWDSQWGAFDWCGNGYLSNEVYVHLGNVGAFRVGVYISLL